MRYVNLNTTKPSMLGQRALMLLPALVLLSTLAGCASNEPNVELVTGAEATPDLLYTAGFIPVQERDDMGAPLPYEPKPNPYAEQRGRLDKQAVTSFIEARRAFKAGNYEAAESQAQQLAENHPGLSGPWVMLGDIALARREYQAAADHFVKAIAINPNNVNAYLRLAHSQRLMGRFLHAQNTYAQVLSIWPDFPEAHLNLAVLYDVYLNHPLRAQKHMEAYQFLTDGENAQVGLWLAELKQRTGIAPTYE